MTEIIFLINEPEESGYTAKCLTDSIYTEGETLEELKKNIKEAVLCHYEDGSTPKIIRLHYVKDELLPL